MAIEQVCYLCECNTQWTKDGKLAQYKMYTRVLRLKSTFLEEFFLSFLKKIFYFHHAYQAPKFSTNSNIDPEIALFPDFCVLCSFTVVPKGNLGILHETAKEFIKANNNNQNHTLRVKHRQAIWANLVGFF